MAHNFNLVLQKFAGQKFKFARELTMRWNAGKGNDGP